MYASRGNTRNDVVEDVSPARAAALHNRSACAPPQSARRQLAGALAVALVASSSQAASYDAGNESDLIAAINKANARHGPDQIRVTADITLAAPLPAITDALTIQSNGDRHTIRRDDSGEHACSPTATNAFRLLDSSADLDLVNLRLTGGCNLVDQGGAVRVQGADLRVKNSVVTGNQTFVENPGYAYYQGGVGGGIAVLYGSLTLVDSTLSDNSTHGNLAGGGGAAVCVGDLRVLRSVISGNVSNGPDPFGAGIYAIGDYINQAPRAVTIADSIFVNNSAIGDFAYGGGFGAFAEATTISNSQFLGNSAGGYEFARGAGASVQNNHLATAITSIDRVTVAGNSISASNGWGAGLRLTGGLIHVGSSSLFDNRIDATVKARGGAMFLEVADARIVDTTVSDNLVAGSLAGGGGLGILSEAPDPMSLAVYNSTIAGNQANGGAGGGLWLKAENADSVAPTALLESTIVADNYGSSGLDAIGRASAPSEDTAPIIIASHSLIQGSVDVGSGTFTPDGTTMALAGLDAMLLPLADNGGPTKTRAPDAASPVVDQGTNVTGLVFDQRGSGHPRVFGKAADIGAFERRP